MNDERSKRPANFHVNLLFPSGAQTELAKESYTEVIDDLEALCPPIRDLIYAAVWAENTLPLFGVEIKHPEVLLEAIYRATIQNFYNNQQST